MMKVREKRYQIYNTLLHYLKQFIIIILLLLLLLLLQATYLRAAKVNHIGESEVR